MAFTDQTSQRHPTVIVTVAALHGIAAYALITGLAVKYAKEVTTIIEGRNIPVEIPSPEPQPLPKAKPSETVRIEQPMPVPQMDFGRVKIEPVPMGPAPTPDAVEVIQPPRPQPTLGLSPILAKPRNSPAAWATTNDYPARDLREGNQGLTRFSLSIGTDGKVQSCVVLQSSGWQGLDEATCRLVTRRARFDPATDSSGNRVAGSYVSTIRWVIPQD